ncbi:unnamed protein product [Paramecium octaurelia]|uniref:Uncharacterized protein n=1 Tax=Paramecium octaurelia TaxID=43137 RepID=A0A8S1WGX3_PAROT|nr:unnamed protein product [Paramecium octaurelia]
MKLIVVKYWQKDQLLHYIIKIFHQDQFIFLFLLLNLNNHQFKKVVNNLIQIAILMLKNICRGFQDSQHQQILRMIDITIDLRFQQQKNFHQKLKKQHKLILLQS